jgi:Histidine kinase-, DNA gyrase B-, and HSP90-like ATPase
MIPSTVARDSHSIAGSVDNTLQFTIAATGRAFKILSDGLYSDKIKAIIRELSCNARDSHVAAGNADPFVVHLPSNDQPWFAVEDHGVGLSEEDVLNIYTRYFASTKTTSNDFVGQLGLGSKSPFSYTNQFTVVSKHAGTQTTYEMSIDGSGTPRAAKLFSGPCQGTGITVSFAVTRDYQRWHDKAMEVLQWFAQKPIITDGTAQFDPVQAIEPVHQGTGWRIWNKPFWNGGYSQILMGGVLYPLDRHSIPDLDHRIGYLCDFPIVIDMPIGDCDVAASREGLSYDPRTVSNIIARLTAVRDNMVAMVSDAISNAPTLWDAHNQWHANFTGSAGFNMRRVFDDVQLEWQGNNIDRGTMSVDTNKLYKKADNGVRLMPAQIKSVRKHDSFVVTCAPATKIVFDDLKKGGLSRARQMHAVAEYKNVTVLFPPRQGGWEALRAELGYPEVVYTSTLPDVVKKTRTVVQNVWTLNPNNRNGGKWAWKETDPATLPATGKLIYVTVKNWDVITGHKVLGRYGLDTLRSAAVQAGLIKTDTAIYAVRPASVRKLDAQRWIGLHDYLEPMVKTMMAEPKTQALYRAHAEQSQVQDVIPTTINKLSAVVDKLRSKVRDPDSELINFLGGLSDMKAASNVDLGPYRTLQRHYEISMPEFDERTAVGQEAARIANKYAMLKYANLGYHIDHQAMLDLVNYIDAVDTAHVFLSLSKSDAETED